MQKRQEVLERLVPEAPEDLVCLATAISPRRLAVCVSTKMEL
jgi:hypothetical protein